MSYTTNDGNESLDGVSPRRRRRRAPAARKPRTISTQKAIAPSKSKFTGAELVVAKSLIANAKLPAKPASISSKVIVNKLVKRARREKTPAKAARILKASAKLSPEETKAAIKQQVQTAPPGESKKLIKAVMHCNIECFGPEGKNAGLGFVDGWEDFMQSAAEAAGQIAAELGPKAADAVVNAIPSAFEQTGKTISQVFQQKKPASGKAPARKLKKKTRRPKKVSAARRAQIQQAARDARRGVQALTPARSPLAPAASTPAPAPVAASCFPASAKVLTPRGYRPIASLQEGDSVVSGKMRVETVTKKLSYGASEVFCVMLEGRSAPVRTTRHHTFLTKRGWLRADRMRVGDEMIGPNAGRVTGFAVQAAEPVYNLHTTGDHTFVVEGVVAHNFTEFRGLRTAWHQLFVDVGAVAHA